ncbi:MAG: aldo/keto reductase [Firmicutes bacterium HGW-Firmicutes-12]|jgi:aryl-alcohol dehydrogenase-like predicted oxidoreductase|nr:MAG: aldo/keto reductase [Firmicutes bacterium HGW-Firmicutes-12]
MKKNLLGQTGLEVTELCFGSLAMSPLQAKVSIEEGAAVIRKALDEGVNFIDTAEMYLTNPHIAQAIKDFDGEVIIATKSTATSYEDMEKSINNSLKELGRDYLDIFLLHAARGGKDIFEVRQGAYNCLKDYKDKGIIKHIGISTHSVDVVNAAILEEDIEIIFPIINMNGMGIIDGDLDDMLNAIEKARQAKKGLYAMKALAGGNLIHKLEDAIDYVRNINGMSSIAIGMINTQELDVNLRIFRNEAVPEEMKNTSKSTKKLFITNYCKGCGKCVETCPNFALSLQGNKAVVDHDKCLLCGYCNPVCPMFALRLL